MKYTETSYLSTKGILKFPDHYVAIPVTVDNTGIVANADGKKIVPAGTIVGGGVLADPTVKVTTQNDADAEGDPQGPRARHRPRGAAGAGHPCCCGVIP